MNIFKRVGLAASVLFRSAPLPSDDDWRWYGLNAGVRTVSGVHVSPESALSFAAVFAAINCISTDTASLPLPVYRRRKDGGRDEYREHPAWEILNVSPDGERVAMRFRQALMGRTLGWGNGCEEIETAGNGQLIALHALDASVKAARDQGTNKLYYPLNNGERLDPYRVLHIAGLGYQGINGYSPITMAREAVALGKAAEVFNAAYYGNGMRTGGWIKLAAAKLTQEAMDNKRKSYAEVHGGPAAAHKIGFLDPGEDFIPTSISPQDAETIALRKFQLIEIARMYRVPPHKLMDLDNAHLANLEESNLDYLMTTLMPWCEQLEQAMNWRLFTAAERKAGFFVEHNMAAFFRGNMLARAEFLTKMRDLGVLNPNQIARIENFEPIGPAGDVRLVPLNMTTLENAGKPAPVNPAQAKRLARQIKRLAERMGAPTNAA